jgi:RNA polymerase sigma factor (sigma-70 family)
MRVTYEMEQERIDWEQRTLDPTSERFELLHDRSTILALIDSLPDRQRRILMLRFYLDQTIAEIARTLDIPEGTVKSSLSRGIASLRETLFPNCCFQIHGGT